MSIPPLKTSCHCNAITLTTTSPPKYLNECQCSICRRYGAQWAYYPIEEQDHGVQVNGLPVTDYQVGEDGKMRAGEKTLTTRAYLWAREREWFVFCEKCACVMFWYPRFRKEEGGEGQMGINARLVEDPMGVRWVEKRISYEDALLVQEGLYDVNGPVRK